MKPYGAWESPITPQLVASGAVAIGEPLASCGALHWLESRPAESGRVTLLRRKGATLELTPAPYDVRSRVHEYGGGAYLPTAQGAFFVNNQDQNIYRAGADGAVTQLTHSDSSTRFADLCLDVRRRRLVAVTEIHGKAGAPENALAAVGLDDGETAWLHRGHDFYASPRLSADGAELLFIAWDHPNMPWDGTMLLRCRLAENGAVAEAVVAAGGAREAIMQPCWTADGAILYLSDASGFWNLHQLADDGGGPVLTEDADYGGPSWVFALRSYACLNERFIAACRHGPGHQDLLLIERSTGFASPLLENSAGCGYLSAQEGALHFLRAHSDAPAAFVRLDPRTGEQAMLAQPPPIDLRPAGAAHSRSRASARDYFSTPEHITYPARDGGLAYAYLYRPKHPHQATAQGSPPLIVTCHGGPTGAASPALKLLAQFYSSRGWAVLDVDYRGSSGYGRAYREALNGQWGVLDVTDCEDAVRHLIGQGEVDAAKVAIRGGSAGGYTTLRALTTCSLFRAGACHYGIGDLAALARDTHKFEARYLDSLLGGKDALQDRSPIHHLDSLNCSVIFFQGGKDRIVPPNQTRAMFAALRERGLPTAYIEYPREGHGFRDGSNIAHSIGAECAFFCRVFGLPQPPGLPEVQVENL